MNEYKLQFTMTTEMKLRKGFSLQGGKKKGKNFLISLQQHCSISV